ncbi:hypothetical protein M501DRAFT_927962 [Patellaria atrata CBS 101060]|uniref:Uncharacterized protein n=1 Tax=Patellaria atrata CBS 101060 TaxID=1346257 RepID=A0A9P4SH42_9PEZI|nr:hypothetical protein M501DRAFT_927962 [Patellaria atrata CBS 101060]
MPIRNPFTRKPAGGVETQDENRPFTNDDRGFRETKLTGSKAIEIKEPVEYKLSEISDSGVYLPPSPPEKKSFWQTRSNGSTASSHRSVLSEEPFSISRESFDSYRRSFDISARSPIPDVHSPRQSLDTRRLNPPRSSFQDRRIDRPETTTEEGFEDVGLNDEVKPKKRSLFSRFGDSNNDHSHSESRPSSSHHGFHFTGRKRGQSGTGSELRPMPKNETKQSPEVSV